MKEKLSIEECNEILEAAVAGYGAEHQMWKLVEELGELLTAIAKYKIAQMEGLVTYAVIDNIAEEMGDVGIMMDQLRYIMRNTGLVEEFRQAKIKRLAERLNMMKEENEE